MGKGPSKPIPEKVMDDLMEITRLSKKDVQHSWKKFLAQYPSAVVTLEEFQLLLGNVHCPDVSIPYGKHIFRTFNTRGNDLVQFEELLLALSIFKQEGDYSERRWWWAFELFDINGDKHITREELGEVLEAFFMIIQKERFFGETYEELADTVMRTLDTDSDGKITLHEFIQGVKKNWKMLNILCTVPAWIIEVRCYYKLNFKF